ncbi:hypothetical protein SAMN05444359_13927 [Neolewinella agarilytica]|uniref:Uncharacterized protein n=1 Tax=Neolewinella agarilytica TaxID=478744 RepID=A0A1H9NSQ4_9BACT|nr:hypothetical protein SAMN05444359_13927 [Neolewinella agarilytica]
MNLGWDPVVASVTAGSFFGRGTAGAGGGEGAGDGRCCLRDDFLCWFSYAPRPLLLSSKGKKDRYTTLSDSLLVELREYYKEYRPSYCLFEGQSGGQYSRRSVQAIFSKIGCEKLRQQYPIWPRNRKLHRSRQSFDEVAVLLQNLVLYAQFSD